MRAMKTSLLLFGSLLLCVSTTYAQDAPEKKVDHSRLGVGMRASYLDVESTKQESSIGTLELDFRGAGQFGLDLVVYASQYVSMEFALLYQDVDAEGKFSVFGPYDLFEVNQIPLLTTVRFHYPVGTVSPYIGAGFGYYFNDIKSKIPGLEFGTKNSWGWHLKGGAEVFFKERYSFDVSIQHIDLDVPINISGIIYDEIGMGGFSGGLALRYYY